MKQYIDKPIGITNQHHCFECWGKEIHLNCIQVTCMIYLEHLTSQLAFLAISNVPFIVIQSLCSHLNITDGAYMLTTVFPICLDLFPMNVLNVLWNVVISSCRIYWGVEFIRPRCYSWVKTEAVEFIYNGRIASRKD